MSHSKLAYPAYLSPPPIVFTPPPPATTAVDYKHQQKKNKRKEEESVFGSTKKQKRSARRLPQPLPAATTAVAATAPPPQAPIHVYCDVERFALTIPEHGTANPLTWFTWCDVGIQYEPPWLPYGRVPIESRESATLRVLRTFVFSESYGNSDIVKRVSSYLTLRDSANFVVGVSSLKFELGLGYDRCFLRKLVFDRFSWFTRPEWYWHCLDDGGKAKMLYELTRYFSHHIPKMRLHDIGDHPHRLFTKTRSPRVVCLLELYHSEECEAGPLFMLKRDFRSRFIDGPRVLNVNNVNGAERSYDTLTLGLENPCWFIHTTVQTRTFLAVVYEFGALHFFDEMDLQFNTTYSFCPIQKRLKRSHSFSIKFASEALAVSDFSDGKRHDTYTIFEGESFSEKLRLDEYLVLTREKLCDEFLSDPNQSMAVFDRLHIKLHMDSSVSANPRTRHGASIQMEWMTGNLRNFMRLTYRQLEVEQDIREELFPSPKIRTRGRPVLKLLEGPTSVPVPSYLLLRTLNFQRRAGVIPPFLEHRQNLSDWAVNGETYIRADYDGDRSEETDADDIVV